MALGVQTQLGTRGYYSQKYLDSKNAFSQLKQRVTPFVEQEVKSKNVEGGNTSEDLLTGQIAYKKFELKEFSILEKMISEKVHELQGEEETESVKVSKMLAQIAKNKKEKESSEDLSI